MSTVVRMLIGSFTQPVVLLSHDGFLQLYVVVEIDLWTVETGTNINSLNFNLQDTYPILSFASQRSSTFAVQQSKSRVRSRS